MKKIVLITGSTRGIGRTAAIEFAKAKYIPLLNGTKKTEESIQLLKEIKKMCPETNIYYFNVANKQEVKNSIQKIINKYKRIDILINNAGILRDKLFTKMGLQDFDDVLKTNVYGTFLVTKNVIENMIMNKYGRIINISSVIGKIGGFGQVNYATSKAAVLGFTKSLSKEVAKYNITVNAVCPGLVKTDILKNVPEKYMSRLIEKIPLGRMAKRKEIADILLFLASDKSSYITGSAIDINGGWL